MTEEPKMPLVLYLNPPTALSSPLSGIFVQLPQVVKSIPNNDYTQISKIYYDESKEELIIYYKEA